MKGKSGDGPASSSLPGSSSPERSRDVQKYSAAPASELKSLGEPKAQSIQTYFSDGKISSLWTFREGVLWGMFVLYHSNGNIWIEGAFEKGKAHGHWRRLSEEGTLNAEFHYNDGALHGPLKEYYPSGVLWAELTFVEGALPGLPHLFSEDGARTILREDPSGGSSEQFPATYYSNGEKSSGWGIRANRLHGPAVLYRPGGTVFLELAFSEGALEGAKRIYDAEGRLRISLNCAAGRFHGIQRIFYSDGSLLAEWKSLHGALLEPPRLYSEGRVRASSAAAAPPAV